MIGIRYDWDQAAGAFYMPGSSGRISGRVDTRCCMLQIKIKSSCNASTHCPAHAPACTLTPPPLRTPPLATRCARHRGSPSQVKSPPNPHPGAHARSPLVDDLIVIYLAGMPPLSPTALIPDAHSRHSPLPPLPALPAQKTLLYPSFRATHWPSPAQEREGGAHAPASARAQKEKGRGERSLRAGGWP